MRCHGQVVHRMPRGQRTWRQIDVFGVASTQSLGATYCGTKNLYLQLRQYDLMKKVAEGVVALRLKSKVCFHEIVDAIGSVGLIRYAPGGYWSVHLARIFVPSFAGIPLLRPAAYTRRCAVMLCNMGTGGSSMELFGLNEETVYTRGPALCKCICDLGRSWGLELRMELPHLACAACEAHRRSVLRAGAMVRRSGL